MYVLFAAWQRLVMGVFHSNLNVRNPLPAPAMLGHGMRFQLLTARQTDAERERETGFLLYRFCHIPTKPIGMDRAGRLLGVSTPKNAIAQDQF